MLYLILLLKFPTTLQAGRSRVRFPLESLRLFVDLVLQPVTKMITRDSSLVVGVKAAGEYGLPLLFGHYLQIMVSSVSWKLKGLPRPVYDGFYILLKA